MRLTQTPSEFQKALPAEEKLKKQVLRPILLRGSVRDALHNRPIATSSYPEETKQIFQLDSRYRNRAWNCSGLRWGRGREVTTFRTEGCL